jgi:hypothetical protein
MALISYRHIVYNGFWLKTLIVVEVFKTWIPLLWILLKFRSMQLHFTSMCIEYSVCCLILSVFHYKKINLSFDSHVLQLVCIQCLGM